MLHGDQQIRCCHAVSGADTFTDHNKPWSSGNTRILCLNLFAKQGPQQSFFFLTTVCISFTVGLWSWFQRGSTCFTWQSTVNGHRSELCVGVVELSAGPGPSTETLFTLGLAIPELGSTRSPLIFISHLPSNTEGERHLHREAEGDQWATGVHDNEISHVT